MYSHNQVNHLKLKSKVSTNSNYANYVRLIKLEHLVN